LVWILLKAGKIPEDHSAYIDYKEKDYDPGVHDLSLLRMVAEKGF
jgi:hypothetical protein